MNKRPITHLRWYVAVLLCLSSVLNYLDRQTLSVLAETIQRELRLSTIEYSYITSSFLVSYTIMYAVSGRLIDHLGTRRSFMIFVSSWSAANMIHALANTALQLSFFRFLLGVAEPANFPAGVKAASEWFPMRERALAVGIFNAGTAIGAALAVPLVSLIALIWGWRYAFVATGTLGFIWVMAWALFYRLPQVHPRLSESERNLILARVSSPTLALILITGLVFCHSAWGNITLPAEVFPQRVVGTVSGFGGALGGLAGVMTQLGIGWAVQNLSFAPIFAVSSVIYLLALGAVHWLIGELGTVRQLPG